MPVVNVRGMSRNVVLIIGIICLCVALWGFFNTYFIMSSTSQTYAIVVGNIQSNYNSGIFYKPQVDFNTSNNFPVETSLMYTETNPAELGSKILIRYDNTNPQKAFLDTNSSWFPIVFLIIGLFLVVCYVIMRKRDYRIVSDFGKNKKSKKRS